MKCNGTHMGSPIGYKNLQARADQAVRVTENYPKSVSVKGTHPHP